MRVMCWVLIICLGKSILQIYSKESSLHYLNFFRSVSSMEYRINFKFMRFLSPFTYGERSGGEVVLIKVCLKYKRADVLDNQLFCILLFKDSFP